MSVSAAPFRASRSAAQRNSRPLAAAAWLLALVALGAIWLTALDYRPLLSPDEGRYAEIAREMAASGDYVTPFLNGLRYFEKPPLQYWLTALGFEAFGVHDWVARLIPVLYGLLTCLLGWWTIGSIELGSGDRDGRRLAGQFALLMTAAFPWVVLNGHFVSLDMGLTFWLTLTLAGLVRLMAAREDVLSGSRARRRLPTGPALLVWLGLAGGFLSKGLVAWVIPGGVWWLMILAWRRPDWIRLFFWWPGWLIVIAACGPWLLLVESRNAGFLWFFFIHEHFLRYTTELHHRVEPWWYFLPIVLIGLGPWLWHLLVALGAGLGRHRRGAPVDGLLLCWAVVVLLFFSASGSKLPSYVLPMFPALAWWLARRWVDLPASAARAAHLLAALTGVAGLVAAPLLSGRVGASDDAPFLTAFQPWMIAAFAAITLGAALAVRWSRSRPAAAVMGLALGVALGCQVLQWGHSVWGERVSARDLSRRLLAAEGEQRVATLPFYSVGLYDQSLPFYLRRTLTLVDYRDEMGPGLDRDPSRNGPTTAALTQGWRDGPPAYAVLGLDALTEWRATGAPACIVARNEREAIITNRPGAACLAAVPG